MYNLLGFTKPVIGGGAGGREEEKKIRLLQILKSEAMAKKPLSSHALTYLFDTFCFKNVKNS